MVVTRWASIVAGVTALAIASCSVGVTVRQHLVAEGSVTTRDVCGTALMRSPSYFYGPEPCIQVYSSTT
jgi:hypothetical protein